MGTFCWWRGYLAWDETLATSPHSYAGGKAQHGEKPVGALQVDHVGGERLAELGERRLHRVHVFQRRKLQEPTLLAGAVLGHAKHAGPAAEMVSAVVAVFGGGRATGVPIVVNVSASFVFHEAP